MHVFTTTHLHSDHTFHKDIILFIASGLYNTKICSIYIHMQKWMKCWESIGTTKIKHNFTNRFWSILPLYMFLWIKQEGHDGPKSLPWPHPSNVLAKFGDNWVKNVTSSVLRRFFQIWTVWPSFWPKTTHIRTWHRSHKNNLPDKFPEYLDQYCSN
jgi:hypothetical protein